jgi:hypothetical protein
VGLFDSAAVKQLKKDAEFIGGLITQQACGELPPGAAEEMIRSETQRAKLKDAFDKAASEIGQEKALKKATKEAAYSAKMFAEIRKVPSGNLPQLAEEAIRDMLSHATSDLHR